MDLLCREVGKHRGDAGLVPPRGSAGSRDALSVRRRTPVGTTAVGTAVGCPAYAQPAGTPSRGNDTIATIPGAPGKAVNPNPPTVGGGRVGGTCRNAAM